MSYDNDIDLARSLILKETNKYHYRLEKGDEPRMRSIAHDDFAIRLRLCVWVPNMDNSWLAKFWLLEHINKRFYRESVRILFPYRTVVYKKDLSPPLREELGVKKSARIRSANIIGFFALGLLSLSGISPLLLGCVVENTAWHSRPFYFFRYASNISFFLSPEGGIFRGV